MKRYHPSEMPCQLVMDSVLVPDAIKRCLEDQTRTLNPFDLKRRIEAKLKRIFSMVSVTSNVRQRILTFGHLLL